MRTALAAVVLIVILAAGVGWWFKHESTEPQAVLVSKIEALGRKTPIDVDLHASLPGLRSVSVRLQSGGATNELFSETYPATSWRGSLLTDKRIHVEADLAELKVPEGPVNLVVVADTYAWHLWSAHDSPPILAVPLTVDLTPPLLAPLTTQHNVRLGGADTVVFRQSSDTVSSGVRVGKYFFPAVTGYFADGVVAFALFAVPQDLDTSAEPQLVARDAAGNERSIDLPCSIMPQRFAERTLNVDDAFLIHKVPELERLNGLSPSTNLVEGYLHINRDLRAQNEARLRELTATSAAVPLWDGVFHRQSAAPLSSFADRRTYVYKGEVIDHQTHLGFDLASLKLAPVEAAQNGKVVFAENLGIYGNTVVIDHGIGVFSLYGHLSSIAVRPGDSVTVRQTLGQTGETGLAGGDHLHFSILLRGVHIDPVEWWDGHWLRDHVTSKLALLPRAGAQKEGQPK